MGSEKYVYTHEHGYGKLTLLKSTKNREKVRKMSVQSWWIAHDHIKNVICIRLMLALFGMNVFPAKGFWRLFDLPFLVSSLISALFQVVFPIQAFLESNDPINSVLWIFQAIYALIIRYILWTKAQKLYSLIITMINILQYKVGKFQKWSLLCLIFTIIAILFDFVRLMVWFLGPNNTELLSLYNGTLSKRLSWVSMEAIAFTDFWTYCYSTIACLIVSKTFYLFCFHLASECFQVLLTFCKDNTRDYRRIQCITRQYHKIYNLKEELNECLSFIPFLWYSHIFFETTSQIVRNTKDIFALTWETLLFRWGSYLNLLFITIYITYQVDVYTSRELATICKIVQILSESQPASVNMNKNYLINKQILIMEMMRSPTVIPNAWNTFDINRSLILSFFGGVVPFSVMCLEFQQIVNDEQTPPIEANRTCGEPT